MLDRHSDEFGTPQWFFDDLNDEFGPFDVDAASNLTNSKCKWWFTATNSGLTQDWSIVGKKVFCNPPYSKESGPIRKWVDKAILESSKGCTVVMLLPADSRTKWFKRCCQCASEVRLVDGTFRFDGGATSARFGICVAVFRPERNYSYRRTI